MRQLLFCREIVLDGGIVSPENKGLDNVGRSRLNSGMGMIMVETYTCRY
jgi:hypothetical protein